MQPIVWIVVGVVCVWHAGADIAPIYCNHPGNTDWSQCLFDGPTCNWATDFSNWENEHISLQEYNTNPVPGPSSQFIVEGGTPFLNEAGELIMQVVPGDGPGKIGSGTIVSTSRAFLYGTFSARFTSTGVPTCVTSFISVSTALDEIDLEITGADPTNVGANWYFKGTQMLDANGHNINGYTMRTPDDNSKHFHTYTLDWNAERITWAIDGVVQHTSTAASAAAAGEDFPSTPSRISFGAWETSLESTWAGSAPNGIYPTYATSRWVSMNVSCAARNGPPAVVSKPPPPTPAPTPAPVVIDGGRHAPATPSPTTSVGNVQNPRPTTPPATISAFREKPSMAVAALLTATLTMFFAL
ncbi:GH16 domain-containing protein [Plasmodiophora brassicae]